MITDEKGHFELESDHTFKSFEVSFVGMQTAKIAIVPNKAFYKISLVEDSALQEVVVVSKPKKTEEKRKPRLPNFTKDLGKQKKQWVDIGKDLSL